MYEYGVKLDVGTRRPYLVREVEIEDALISDPEAVYKLMNRVFDISYLAEEHIYMLACDIRGRTIGLFEVAHGFVNGCQFQPREILIRALLVGAVRIVLVHNHPSGIPDFSQYDVDATKKLANACRLIGIELVDHIAIAETGFYSAASEIPDVMKGGM